MFKSILSLTFVFALLFSPINEAKADEVSRNYSTVGASVVVGIVVGHFAGPLVGLAAGVAVSATTSKFLWDRMRLCKDAVHNDVQEFYASGILSLALESSINDIQNRDSSVSEDDAIDLILAAVE